jgi:hypothetical protein
VEDRIRDANPLTADDLGADDPDLSIDAIWGAIARQDELNPTARRDHQRRRRRRNLARTCSLGVAALAALSGSALAAGDALGVIDLGGGASATPVSTLPVWDGANGTFVSGTADGQYIYELTGVGRDPALFAPCGPSDPVEADYITSTQPLSQSVLEEMLDPANPQGITPSSSTFSYRALGITGVSAGCFSTAVAGTPIGAAPAITSPSTSGETDGRMIPLLVLADHGKSVSVFLRRR